MTPQAELADGQPDPLVAVIVPARDDGDYIRPCLRSIREQWFPSLECVVVDDGSTDETLSIAQEFADKDDRFRVVSHPTSRGPSAARNSGLSASSAPFVTFLDADDFLYQHAIKRRLEAVQQADPDVVAGAFCDWQATAQNQGRTPPERAATEREEVVGFADGPECPFIVTAPIVRRAVLERVGGFDETLPTAEDFDLWVRVLREGYTFVYVPMIGVAYRQKSSGLVFSGSAHHAEAAVKVIERQYDDVSEEASAPLLSLPLSYYQKQSARARRLLRTYALAAANEDFDDVDRIGRLIPSDVDVLVRAGLDVHAELRAGAWRASRAIVRLRDPGQREEFVQRLAMQLHHRPSATVAGETPRR